MPKGFGRRYDINLTCEVSLNLRWWSNSMHNPLEVPKSWWTVLLVFICHLFNFFILNFSYWISFTFIVFLFSIPYFKFFDFGLLWILIMKKDKCIILSLQKYIPIRNFKMMWRFLIESIFFRKVITPKSPNPSTYLQNCKQLNPFAIL